jgi:pyrroline-5-carboxylate reductase
MERDLKGSKIAFLGTGKMASSIVKALLREGHISASHIIATHYREDIRVKLRAEFPSIRVMDSNSKAAELADIIFLCVRPQQVGGLLKEVQPYSENKIIVSIAAGIKLATLKQHLPLTTRIFHLHPSSLIFQSERKYCISFLTSVPNHPDEMQSIVNIISPISEVLIIGEEQIDKYIVMVGCVPGYLALLWKYLLEIAESLGIERNQAFEFERKVTMGIQYSIFEEAYNPNQIIDTIATSGGVTRAGIGALEKNNLKGIIEMAVEASLHKLKEISER